MEVIFACTITTVTYFLTSFFSARLFTLITHQPIDLARETSGPIMGICLIVIPYIINGYYCRKTFSNPLKGALISSLILVISERALIYLIGSGIALNGGDGSMEGVKIMMFIQGEAAPYYTIPYIAMGVLSVIISVIIASIPRKALMVESE